MINLINKYVEMQKKLENEYGVIGVSTSMNVPEVLMYHLDKFIESSNGSEIKLTTEIDGLSYPYRASFFKNNIEFFIFLSKRDYEEIIKIEGVTHE